MALHWNIEKCENCEEIKAEGEWAITENLIWMSMAVGMGSITEQNWKEFLFRLRVIEKLDGAILMKPKVGGGKEDVFYTQEMVRKRIGLYTNVSTETRAAWIKRVTKYSFERMDKEIEEKAAELSKKPNLTVVK